MLENMQRMIDQMDQNCVKIRNALERSERTLCQNL